MVTRTCVAKTVQGTNITQQVMIGGTIRLLMYGGAKKSSDNNAFYFAAQNVQKDYNNDMCIYSVFLTEGAKQIATYIKNQPDNSIQSLDIFCHGNQTGIYFEFGVSMTKDVESAKRSILYQTRTQRISNYISSFGIDRDYSDQYDIGKLKLSAFANACKIEIHGCSTAIGSSNFCSEFSSALYKAGKKRSVVIGHQSKANPNINGKNTANAQQDYRHGTRAIFHNGVLKKIVTQSGRISSSVINQAIG